MEKKNKVLRGTASSFGFKKPVTAKATIQSNNATTPVDQLTDSVESLVIPAKAQTGIPRPTRPIKDSNAVTGRANRFGFRPPSVLSNKVADSQTSINGTKTNFRIAGMQANNVEENKLTHGSRSQRQRPQQFPVRLATPANYHPRTASVDKSAKTAANNHMARRSRSANGGSSASSVNDADSGVGSQKSEGELDIIEQLECSPSARCRLRNPQKSHINEMIYSNGHDKKKIELKHLSDSIEVTEIMPLKLPPLPITKRLVPLPRYVSQINRGDDDEYEEDDGGIDAEVGEEKLHRDRVVSEKDERVMGAGEEAAVPEDVDEMWGHGEAMIGEDDFTGEQDSDVDLGSKPPPLRSVLLSIEDHSFAALAAMSSSTMLEDESYPELPDFHQSLSLTSTSTVTSPNSSPPKQKAPHNSEGGPGTPDTPTHTSNSLSLSSDIRDRDFIDDEICDQPGLVYDNVTANSSGNTLVPEEPSPKVLRPVNAMLANLSVDCASAHHSSVGTLSPCESITSDDLIMDFDLSAVGEDQRSFYRLDTSSLDMALTDVEGDDVLEKTKQELSSLIAAHPELLNGVRATRQLRPRVGSSGSGADSPRSLDTPRLRSGSALSSPLRSSRQGTSSPGDDLSEDSGIRVHRGTYQSMYQDVINIKALLLRLSRIVQENDADLPHSTSQKNGFHTSACDLTVDSQQEMVADLQRQVVFLQSQVEEKDRKIRCLQTHQPLPTESRVGVETCNAATQTERVRPLSTGPIMSTQPDSAGGSLVSSSSDSVKSQPSPNTRPPSRLPQWRRAPSPSLDELHKPLPLFGRRQT